MNSDALSAETARQEIPVSLVTQETASAAQEPPAAEPSYEEIRRFSALLRRQQGYVSSEEMEEAFQRELAQCQLVSFDIFDTLLFRYVEHPKDVFLHLPWQPAFRRHKFSASLKHLRLEAEASARRIVYQEIQSWEVALPEIYACFCDRNDLSRELVPSFVAAEEEVERKLCVASPALLALYRQAREAGKRIVFVSDTYHSSEFLASLLQQNGFEVSPGSVFSSAERRGNKAEGKLFRIVMEEYPVAAESILHVGDHPVSDCEIPRKLGIHALLHPFRASAVAPPPAANDPNAVLHSYCQGLARVTACDLAKEKTFWWRLGYRVCGPLTAGYCQWLNARMRADRIDHAWFVLRDCEVIAKVYNALFPGENGKPKVSTLPLSRRAMLLPVIEMAPAVALSSTNGLLSGMPMPVREYFERLHLDPARFAEVIAQSGFPSMETVIDPAEGEQYKLFTQPAVLQALIERAAVEREALTAYLRQEGMLDARRIAMVDIGWSGTAQKAMHTLLAQVAPKSSLKGYYLVTTHLFLANAVPGMQQLAYLVNHGEPRELLNLLTSSIRLLESFFTSKSGSLLYFEMRNGTAVPVFGRREKSAEEEQYLDEVHAGAVAFATDFQKHSGDFQHGLISPQIAMDSYLKMFTHPSPEEAQHIGELQHSEGMGSQETHYLAKWPPSATTMEGIWTAYKKGWWKMGLVRQTNAQAAALRTLLWLKECHKF
jgi:FMN phosphatase YigB (HAD superfamily)